MRVSTTHDELPNTNGRLTDVAVNMVLDIGIVGPYYMIDAVGQILEEEPNAQKSNTKVPALSDEASQEYEKKHCRR